MYFRMSVELTASFRQLIYCSSSYENEIAVMMSSIKVSFDFETECAVQCEVTQSHLCVTSMSALISSAIYTSYTSICA